MDRFSYKNDKVSISILQQLIQTSNLLQPQTVKSRDHTVKATKKEEVKVYRIVYQNLKNQKNSQFCSQKDKIWGHRYKVLFILTNLTVNWSLPLQKLHGT